MLKKKLFIIFSRRFLRLVIKASLSLFINTALIQ